MEIKSLVRDMGALEDGRWVDKAEVPGLGDLRVKMRGSQTDTVRKMLAEKDRAGEDRGHAINSIVVAHCLIDIEGLTNGGKPVAVEDLRPMMMDTRMEPLQLLLLDVIRAVDATREQKAIDLSKN